MTKDKIDSLLGRFEALNLRMNNEGAVHEQDSARTDALATSVISLSIYLILCSIPSSTVERIEAELRDVSDHIKSVGHAGSNEDTKTMAELADYIRDAITNYQVSGRDRAMSMI